MIHYVIYITAVTYFIPLPFYRVELHRWWDTCYIWKDSLRDWWTGSSFVGYGCSLLAPATDHSAAEPHRVTQEQHTKQRHCHGRSFTSAEGGHTLKYLYIGLTFEMLIYDDESFSLCASQYCTVLIGESFWYCSLLFILLVQDLLL